MLEHLVIRSFIQSDFDDVFGLHINLYDHISKLRPDLFFPASSNLSTEKKEFIDYCNEPSTVCYVAVLKESIIGYISAYVCNPPENQRCVKRRFMLLDEIFVSKEFRGNGVGTVLIDNLIKDCEKKEIDRIELFAIDSNKNAIELYNRLGFVNQTIRMERILKQKS